MALSNTLFILREPGKVPELKRAVEGKEVGFLKELMEARPGALITLVTPGDVPMVEDGPEVLEIYDRRYRHRARRHRASTRAAFRAADY